jgi:hypothetical protein
MILIALALALIAIYCGMNLLSKAKKENSGMLFTFVSWLIIIGGCLIIAFACCRGICHKCCMSSCSTQSPINIASPVTTQPAVQQQQQQQQQQQVVDSIPHGGGGSPK